MFETLWHRLCFDAAKILARGVDPKKAQDWLRRGWTVSKEYVGNEIDLSRYSELPLKGDVPGNLPKRMPRSLPSSSRRDTEEWGFARRFTIRGRLQW